MSHGATITSPTAVTITTRKQFTLTNLSPTTAGSDSAATIAALKVVWAAQVANVSLVVRSNSSNNSNNNTNTNHKDDSGLKLWYGNNDDHVMVAAGHGGNAMAMAVYGGTTACMSTAVMHCIDEWCEWERTVLRPACINNSNNNIALTSAIQHMEQALLLQQQHYHGAAKHACAAHSIIPTIGLADAITVADIVLVVTLSSVLQQQPQNHQDGIIVPPIVQHYVDAHQTALQMAQAALKQLIQQDQATTTAATSLATTSIQFETVIDRNEPSLSKVLDACFRQVIQAVFGGTEVLTAAIPPSQHIIQRCKDAKFGDYQCIACMALFSYMKKMKQNQYVSPMQMAQAVVDAFGKHHPVVTGLMVSPPGFILCHIQASFLEPHLVRMIGAGRLPMPILTNDQKQQVCVVDFSSPNIAKEMHVGHLRSTIIGESVCRILESVGYHVHRVNHVGDWGTQFGMLIQYLREEYPQVADGTTEQSLPNIADLTVFYKSAKSRFDDDADFKKQAQQNVVALQAGDSSCLAIWKMLCDISRQEFQKVYDRLDVTVEEFGESFYNSKIPAVITEMEQAGRIKLEEGGAKCIFLDGFKVPLMLQKSDGGYGYDSTDMAALKYRLHELKADRIIIITDFSQGDHFKMIYKAGHEIGWVDRGQRLDHIGFGIVMGDDGKRFRTRSGETVRLVDLLDEAVHRMEVSLQERLEQGKANITPDEIHSVAEAIGYGAVKYFDLRRNPTTNYKFSYDQMLDTKGDTAVYLLYARVRLESILAKAKEEYQVDIQDLIKEATNDATHPTVVLTHPSERNVALHLQWFADVMEQTLDDLFPYHICEYIYKLATAASDFCTQCKVLGSPEMHSRLLLCHATVVAMKECFDLLGIRHVKRI